MLQWPNNMVWQGLDKSKSPETLLEQIKAASGPELVEQPELIWVRPLLYSFSFIGLKATVKVLHESKALEIEQKSSVPLHKIWLPFLLFVVDPVQCNPRDSSLTVAFLAVVVTANDVLKLEDAKQTQMQVFGPVLTLAGFPPWMVRHSEIHAMGLLQDITEQRVDNALKKYCQTSQRFGS